MGILGVRQWLSMLRSSGPCEPVQTVGFRCVDNPIATLNRWNMWNAKADSCAGVTAYCSVLAVGYDISCGSSDSLSFGNLRTRSDALYASGEG